MPKIFQALVKFTGWPIQAAIFRTKIHYENKSLQSRKIKGPAIIISNHTSVYDFAAMLFVFPHRTLRYLMAEVLFEKKGLGKFLKRMGGITVDRNSYDFSFVDESLEILECGGVVGIFPESRIPNKDEQPPIPFKPSAAFIALLSGAPVIPVYTDGNYFTKKRAHVIIGTPIDPQQMHSDEKDEKLRLEKMSEELRQKIILLKDELERQKGQKRGKRQ